MRHVTRVTGGELMVGLGAAYAADGHYSLSGLEGDLFSPAVVSLAYGLGRGAVVEVWSRVFNILYIDSAGAPSVDLDPQVAEGTTSDFGDVNVATRFIFLGSDRGLSAGLGASLKVPSSNESKGIGTNTTDVALTALLGFGADRWRISTEVGVGILEAPLENFEQNDVVVYAAEVLAEPARTRLRFAAGVRGRASTRGRVPLGTEDRGEFVLGADFSVGCLLLDAGLSLGYAGSSPRWGLVAGVSRTFRS